MCANEYMFYSYWMIKGVGINADKIEPFIDKKKLTKMLLEQLPDNEGLLEIASNENYEELDIEDFMHSSPFDNLGDLLTYCDDTDSLTYGDDGECRCGTYFYYPPSMPWERLQNEPETLEEVHHRIVNAVQVITNLSDNEIEAMIDDDLCVVGCG